MAVNVRIRNGMEPTEYGGGVTEGDLRGSTTDMIDNTSGVVDVAGGHLLVHQSASPDMNVIVDAGVCYIPNDSFDELDSDSIKFWEAVVAGTELSRTLSINSNSSGQTRIDLICVYIDPGTTPDEDGGNIADVIVVQGTPGAGIPATPSYHVKLAEITVLNGATSIPNAKITDTREQLKVKLDYLPVIGEDDMSSDSATEIPTQQSVKAYVDDSIAGIGRKTKVIQFSRSLGASAGDVDYNGVCDFTPSAIYFSYLSDDGNCVGHGYSDIDKGGGSLFVAMSAAYKTADSVANKCIYISNASGKNQQAIVKTYNATGFTLTYSVTGAAMSGNMQCIALLVE